MEILTVRDLSFTYPGQTDAALRGVSFALRQGEFVALAGPSGSGKSTLLRQLKPALAPHGLREGTLRFAGTPLDSLAPDAQARRIGFVQQSPDSQPVTDKVWHELAFGLESLGTDTPVIRARVAEMACFFGIQSWFYRDVATLSGGQKQLLNLASVMVMQPDILILDEPTSQLDPIAAADFLSVLGRINRELGTTVLLSEHRLEEVFPLADRVLVMDVGQCIADGSPARVGELLRQAGHPMFRAMPTAMRIWAALGDVPPCPVTVRDGRTWLEARAAEQTMRPLPPLPAETAPADIAAEFNEVYFRYRTDLPDVLRGLSFTVGRGELFAVLGGNGSGKTTMLSLAAGLRRPYAGQIRISGRAALLPQDPQALFVKPTVREELYALPDRQLLTETERQARIGRVISLCRLEALLDRHPYDLSGGEQQRAALAKVLLTEPELLLLDEPTKGLDADFKAELAALLLSLCQQGVTVLMVSHDVEFCAEYAHHCALCFDGGITAQGRPREFFSGNSFYTTAANRMARAILPEAVVAADVIRACGGTVPREDDAFPAPVPISAPRQPETAPEKLPLWRRLLAALSGAGVLAALIGTLRSLDLSALLTSEGLRTDAYRSGWLWLFVVSLALLAASVSRRDTAAAPPPGRKKLPRRTLAAAVTILLLIPLTVFAGVRFLGDRKYYFIALLVLLEAMLPFVLVFEGRKPRARELVLIASLCAIGTAGRAAFFMLPGFKPVMAVVILSGVALGAESGFLVGAMTMLVSNILFGQGPWTPWQMFAMGLVGFLAGVLYRRGILRRSRLSLCIFGAVMAVFVYGGILNPAAALIWAHSLTAETLLAYYITGFPVDLVHGSATFLILWFIADPMLEKLARIQQKYGLAE